MVESLDPENANQHFGARVRELRIERKWSLEELATRSEVSRSMLSQIERQKANPTLPVTIRIARALGLTLGDMLQVPSEPPPITVVRGNDPAYTFRIEGECQLRPLSPSNQEKNLQIYELQLQAGGELKSSGHPAGTREFLTVQKGMIRVNAGDNSEILKAGDSASYLADLPHEIVNFGRGVAVGIMINDFQTR